MTKWLVSLWMISFLLPLTARAQSMNQNTKDLVLGVRRPDLFQNFMKGKRVALVVNQASLSNGAHSIDILRDQGVQIVKLFALEHGVRGQGGAGEKIPDSIDVPSGIPIVSLYGNTRKPTPQMLKDVGAIVYDIQDVGVRFYTYISSLGKIMEAAKENSLPVIVLDRPNPNGEYVAGPVLKTELLSFVGAFPIPIVYGLTAGELAKMIEGENWSATQGVQLHVVPMKNYERNRIYTPESPPSPGLRNINAIRIYPSIALFEPTIISVGRGTDNPYQQYGLPEAGFGPHRFTPTRRPYSTSPPLYEGNECFGHEFIAQDVKDVPKFTWQLVVDAVKKVKKKPFVLDERFFSLLIGDKQIVAAILEGKSASAIEALYGKELADYDKRRKKYLMY